MSRSAKNQRKQPKPRLADHRRRLKDIAPDEEQLRKLADRLSEHLNSAGLSAGKGTEALRIDIVKALLGAQDGKPFFWIEIEGELPFCWNRPDYWGEHITHILYEWGHVDPRNNERDPKTGKEAIENLCLMSSRCNNHIQSSLDMQSIRKYFDGSKVAERIDLVLGQRTELFAFAKWTDLMSKLKAKRDTKHGRATTSKGFLG
jgi:hypothetical protein